MPPVYAQTHITEMMVSESPSDAHASSEDDTIATTARHADAAGLAQGGEIRIKDVINNLRKRKRGKAMPSTVRRHKERRQRRRTHNSEPSAEQTLAIAPPPVEPEHPEPAVVAPQLTLDENGNIIVDSSSLVVSAGTVTNAEAESGDVTAFENHDYTKHITSATFSKRAASSKWETEETDLFYQCLRKYGTDFLLMEREFANRNRRQLKLKFKREERENLKRIDDALRAPSLPLPTSVPTANLDATPPQIAHVVQSNPKRNNVHPVHTEQLKTTTGAKQTEKPETAEKTKSREAIKHVEKTSNVEKAVQLSDSDHEANGDANNNQNEATREVVTQVLGRADDDPDMEQEIQQHMADDDSDDSWGDSGEEATQKVG